MSDADVTSLLRAWSEGSESAGEALLPLIYAELRRISSRQLRGSGGAAMMQTTELINEAWLRMSSQQIRSWQSRAHFFALAATMARRVLVDHARRQLAQRRDRRLQMPLDQAPPAESGNRVDLEILALHQALEHLAEVDQRQARVVELRYFGGLTIEESAVVLDISEATVKREWTLAKARLRRYMESGATSQQASDD